MSSLGSDSADEFSAANRLDPYYDGLWSTGNTAGWLSADTVARQVEAGLIRVPAALGLSQEKGLEQAIGRDSRWYSWQNRVAFLGSLHAWRTCTAEQLAALTGEARFADPLNQFSAGMFTAGVVDLGLVNAGLGVGDTFGRHTLMRPARGDAFDSRVAPRLSWAERVAATGGQPWTSGGQYDRHNVLTTEVALRIAEYTEAALVLGERFSTTDLLAGTGVGRAPIVGDRRTGDMTVVREDGLRIVIEVTTSISPTFDRKVEAWARLMEETPLRDSGLCVLFLVAPQTGDGESEMKRVRNRTFQAAARAARANPGFSGDRTGARIGVASWREWFPSRHTVSDAFLEMGAWSLTDPDAEGEGMWSRSGFLDPDVVELEAADPDALTAVLANGSLLGQTPHWMRDEAAAPSLAPMLLAEHGLEDLGEVAPRRKDRAASRRLGEGVGVAADTRVPRRLRGFSAS